MNESNTPHAPHAIEEVDEAEPTLIDIYCYVKRRPWKLYYPGDLLSDPVGAWVRRDEDRKDFRGPINWDTVEVKIPIKLRRLNDQYGESLLWEFVTYFDCLFIREPFVTQEQTLMSIEQFVETYND